MKYRKLTENGDYAFGRGGADMHADTPEAVGQAVLDRAAKLLCVGLASVLQFVGAGRDPKAPACVGLHGAAFSFPPVKAAWEHQVQTYLRDTLGLSITLCYGENMLPTGAAAEALYSR